MSKNTLLISVANIKERTSLHGNVDEKFVLPTIKICQDMFIRPAVGSDLYDRLLTGVDNDDLNSHEITLIDDYICDALAWFVLSELPAQLIFQFYNKGVVKKTDGTTDTLTVEEIINIENKHKKYAEHYKECLIKYLREKIEDFPEYKNYTIRFDSLIPEKSGYSTSIFLDDSTPKKMTLEERYQGVRGLPPNDFDYGL